MTGTILQERQLIPYETADLPPAPWLVFAPHPDDETFGMGGTLLLARQQGIAVSLVVLTDGTPGRQAPTPDQLAVRETEAREVAAQLGFQHLEFWRERDRKLYMTEALIQRVATQVETGQPTSVFFPSPMELHPDHRAAAALVWQGLQRARFRGTAYAYEITVQMRVNRLIDITAVAAEKKQVMSLYTSQVAGSNYIQLVEALDVARTFTLPPHVRRAEGFFAFPAGCPGLLAAHTIASLRPFFGIEAGARLPLVSAIVRTRDRPLLLQEALQSIAMQTYPQIEVIVVNDGGQDVGESVAWLGELVSRLEYVALPESRGRAAAANAGLDRVTGDYVMFLDDDDLLDPTHVAGLVEALQTHPEVHLAYTGVRLGSGRRARIVSRPYDPVKLRINNLFPIHAAMFDRRLLDAGCRFDEHLNVFEDWDFWLQIAEMTDFLHLDQVSATYRQIGVSGLNFAHFDPSVAQDARAEILEKWSKRWSGTQLAEIMEALTQERKTALAQLTSSRTFQIASWLTGPARWIKRWRRRRQD